MGFAATLYNRLIVPIQNGRREAQDGVRAARELSARAAGANTLGQDSMVPSAVPHAPDHALRAQASLQAAKMPQGRNLGVNAAGSQSPQFRLVQEPGKADIDSDLET